jgi:hypothetical protein
MLWMLQTKLSTYNFRSLNNVVFHFEACWVNRLGTLFHRFAGPKRVFEQQTVSSHVSLQREDYIPVIYQRTNRHTNTDIYRARMVAAYITSPALSYFKF